MGNIWSSATKISVFSGPSLRDEFNLLIDEGIGQYLIHRSMDSQKCACWNETYGSSSDCKYCFGETYRWTESFVLGYFTQTFGRSLAAPSNVHVLHDIGFMDQDKALIYLKFDATPKTGDAIFRIRTNIDGKPYYPVERIEKWRLTNVEDKRAEGGKLMYFICVCERTEV